MTDWCGGRGKSNDWLKWWQWTSQMTDWCSDVVTHSISNTSSISNALSSASQSVVMFSWKVIVIVVIVSLCGSGTTARDSTRIWEQCLNPHCFWVQNFNEFDYRGSGSSVPTLYYCISIITTQTALTDKYNVIHRSHYLPKILGQKAKATAISMDSSRMRTSCYSGHLSYTHAPLPCIPPAMHTPCHACPPGTHDPLPHMPPYHACPPAMHATHVPLPHMPPAMHAPLPHMPPAMHAPLPHMPPCHTCPPATHAPLPPPWTAGMLVKTLPSRNYCLRVTMYF